MLTLIGKVLLLWLCTGLLLSALLAYHFHRTKVEESPYTLFPTCQVFHA